MNIDSIRIPPKHYPHFDLVCKMQALRTQNTEFKLYSVWPVDTTNYLLTGIVTVRVSLATEIDKELFEAWLDNQNVPDGFLVTYNIGRSIHDKMSRHNEDSDSDAIEYHCCNCGVPVHASDFTARALQRYEYCEACWERGE